MKSNLQTKEQYIPVQESDVGIDQRYSIQIAGDLSNFLADTYSLYLKTQNFHWNVKGLLFYSLHTMFEKNYEKLNEAIDEIAERITSLGFYAKATFDSYNKMTQIKGENQYIPAREMVHILTKDHENVIRMGRKISKHAGIARDSVTLDMIVRQLTMHEKMAWMLRSSLQELHLLSSKHVENQPEQPELVDLNKNSAIK